MNLLVILLNACMVLELVSLYATAPRTTAGSSRVLVSQHARKKWQPATYKGITVGTSTLTDALKVFGEPVRKDFAEPDSDSSEVWYVYNDAGELPGQFTVAIDKKTQRVTAMMIAMLEEVRKETVIELLGNDYEVVRYDACPDDPDAEAGTFYESPNGNATFIEYRSRGIAVSVNYKGIVNGIDYLARPPGRSSRKECPPLPHKQESPNGKGL